MRLCTIGSEETSFPLRRRQQLCSSRAKGVVMAARAVTRVEERGFPWWWVLIHGVALLIVGALLLCQPRMTVFIVLRLVGLFWCITGIMNFVSFFLDRSLGRWKLATGLLGVLAGMAAIRHPLWSSTAAGLALVALLGAIGTIVGAIALVQATKGAGSFAAILGVSSLLFGLLLLANAWELTFALPTVTGAVSLVGGGFLLIVALRIK